MKLIENDVRLMRRILVALRYDKQIEVDKIVDYLRNVRETNMVLPAEQSKEQREGFLARLLDNEKWLAREFGCILLPDYYDCIFLNSKWSNQYTLYVRLVAPVDELGELGEVYWTPESEKVKWTDFAEKNHEAYLKATAELEEEPGQWWKRLWDFIRSNYV